MTSTELSALIVAICSVAAVVLLAVALISITKTLKEVRRTVELLREVTSLLMNRLANLGGVKAREAAPEPAADPNVLPMRSA